MAGELVSCIAAFLLAYEPIKRLTRLNVSLNGLLFNVQTFYALVDARRPKPTMRRSRICP
jgi:hypothetical protein